MGQTLTHGVYLPDEGERNCYNGLAANWSILDGAVGTVAEHTSALAGKAPLVHTHTKSDVTDLLNSNFIPSADVNYTLGSSDLKWKQVWCSVYKTKSGNIDFTNSTTTGSSQSWWIDAMEKNGTGFFGVGSIRSHSAGLNEEHFRIKNAGGKWADLYIQLGDNNQFTIGTATHSDVTNNGFRGKFTPFDSFIPNSNNSYDLGSSSYQWNNLYAKNYYYNGVAWGLDKANVWSENNSFPGITIVNSSWSGVTPPSSAKPTIIEFKNSNTRQGRYINRIGVNTAETWIETIRNVDANTSHNFTVIMQVDNSGNKKLLPYNSDADLGQSTSQSTGRWKTLNGVNPGALSLPDYSRTMDIDTTNWSKSGNMIVYTPTFDGWLQITIPNDDDGEGVKSNMISILDSGASPLTGFSVSNILGPRLYFLYPVRASRVYWLYVKSYSETITVARLIKCMGNV